MNEALKRNLTLDEKIQYDIPVTGNDAAQYVEQEIERLDMVPGDEHDEVREERDKVLNEVEEARDHLREAIYDMEDALRKARGTLARLEAIEV